MVDILAWFASVSTVCSVTCLPSTCCFVSSISWLFLNSFIAVRMASGVFNFSFTMYIS